MAEQQKQQRPLVGGVSALVMNGDRVLLVKRANVHGAGTWAAPGGHLEFGETFYERATKEVKEETGADISDIHFRVITNDVFEAEQKHYITVWMDAKYVSGEIAVNAPYEEAEVGWFTWSSLPEPLFLPLKHLLDGETFPSQTTREKLAERG